MSTIAQELDQKLDDLTGRIEAFVRRLSTTKSLQGSLEEGAAAVGETAAQLSAMLTEARAAVKSIGEAETAIRKAVDVLRDVDSARLQDSIDSVGKRLDSHAGEIHKLIAGTDEARGKEIHKLVTGLLNQAEQKQAASDAETHELVRSVEERLDNRADAIRKLIAATDEARGKEIHKLKVAGVGVGLVLMLIAIRLFS